ncbi:Uma2 family endonuclease [[Limnothrix rosea] IAM M-220]|uniref:Uma2 family endonuclease n=1 Tax=[Limnothrix rosea] IAM M-220 TaxID=454133 RepID=UPI0009FCB55A|nr:Uma2 family endonuclease [[Limnothrix rosea] IAM M-220]
MAIANLPTHSVEKRAKKICHCYSRKESIEVSGLVAAVPQKQKRYSLEEYLALEAESEVKHEYRDGEIIEMAGGTTNHNKLAGKLYALLLMELADQNCEVYIGDVRLWIPKTRKYTYPDVMIVRDEPIYTDTTKMTITNPIVIAEVLSSSTQNYDQGEKFDAYRSIPNFSEYLLIDQYQCYVKHFAKTAENQWLLTDCKDINTTISFASIDFKLALAELYKSIVFK